MGSMALHAHIVLGQFLKFNPSSTLLIFTTVYSSVNDLQHC